MSNDAAGPGGSELSEGLGVSAPPLVVFFRFRAKGTTPKGHRGRRAKRAAFAANLRAVRVSLKTLRQE